MDSKRAKVSAQADTKDIKHTEVKVIPLQPQRPITLKTLVDCKMKQITKIRGGYAVIDAERKGHIYDEKLDKLIPFGPDKKLGEPNKRLNAIIELSDCYLLTVGERENVPELWRRSESISYTDQILPKCTDDDQIIKIKYLGIEYFVIPNINTLFNPNRRTYNELHRLLIYSCNPENKILLRSEINLLGSQDLNWSALTASFDGSEICLVSAAEKSPHSLTISFIGHSPQSKSDEDFRVTNCVPTNFLSNFTPLKIVCYDGGYVLAFAKNNKNCLVVLDRQGKTLSKELFLPKENDCVLRDFVVLSDNSLVAHDTQCIYRWTIEDMIAAPDNILPHKEHYSLSEPIQKLLIEEERALMLVITKNNELRIVPDFEFFEKRRELKHSLSFFSQYAFHPVADYVPQAQRQFFRK